MVKANSKVLALCLPAALLLGACADGKFAWDIEEEKKKEESHEDPSLADAAQWEIGNDTLSDENEDLETLFNAYQSCLREDPNSILNKAIKEYFKGAEIKSEDIESEFRLRAFKNANMTIILFSYAASTESSDKMDARRRSYKEINLTNIPSEQKHLGKLIIDVKETGFSPKAAQYRSVTGFPVLGFRETVIPPSKDEFGVVQEGSRVVRGVQVVLPRGYSDDLKFEVVGQTNREAFPFNLKAFRQCLSEQLHSF